MKACKSCGAVKSLDDFYAHKKSADGRLGICKECAKARSTRNRNENIERVRAYDRDRASLPNRRANMLRVSAEWRKKHADRRAAQVAVNNAVRDGRLHPWPACALPSCDSTKTEAHHADYSRPLEVVWLCPPHHKQAHAMFTRLIAN